MDDGLTFAVDAALAAGAATLEHFGAAGLEVETKDDGSPVTRADREAERILRRCIETAYPDDGILGEEFGGDRSDAARRWILDPIDGTKSFARGVPLYGTLVALEEEGRAVLGVVYLPALGEMVYAARGEGAWWRTGIGGPKEEVRPARVSTVDRVDEALFCTTSLRTFERTGRSGLYDRLSAAARVSRGWGDCFGHALVATGRAEIMVDPIVSVWDVAPLQPIVEEAGGVFMDLSGRSTHRGGSGISTNRGLADTIRGMLAD
ncbi:MAG: histidinol-phosphatase [Planctomycetota bacterium]|jgi:histidinol phosphatase-like enzyme (inositol monophosphatase family)